MTRPLQQSRRTLRWSIAALALCCALPGATAQSLGDEAVAKAKLVAALIRFVQWPSATFESEASPVRLCIHSQSQSVERAFRSYDNTVVGRRPLQLSVNPSREARGCHAVYLDASTPVRREHQVGDATFTIGAADGFLADGGMVEIVHVENAIRFDVNLEAVRDAGLSINPGVLKLARRVKQ